MNYRFNDYVRAFVLAKLKNVNSKTIRDMWPSIFFAGFRCGNQIESAHFLTPVRRACVCVCVTCDNIVHISTGPRERVCVCASVCGVYLDVGIHSLSLLLEPPRNAVASHDF